MVPIRVNWTSCTDSADRLSTIEEEVEFNRLQDLRPQTRKNFFDRVHHVDDVGAGLSLNANNDGPFIFEPARDFIVFNAVDGSTHADILDPHRRAVAVE